MHGPHGFGVRGLQGREAWSVVGGDPKEWDRAEELGVSEARRLEWVARSLPQRTATYVVRQAAGALAEARSGSCDQPEDADIAHRYAQWLRAWVANPAHPGEEFPKGAERAKKARAEAAAATARIFRTAGDRSPAGACRPGNGTGLRFYPSMGGSQDGGAVEGWRDGAREEDPGGRAGGPRHAPPRLSPSDEDSSGPEGAGEEGLRAGAGRSKARAKPGPKAKAANEARWFNHGSPKRPLDLEEADIPPNTLLGRTEGEREELLMEMLLGTVAEELGPPRRRSARTRAFCCR